MRGSMLKSFQTKWCVSFLSASMERLPPPGSVWQGLALPRAPLVLASQLRPATFVWNIGIGQEWVMPDRAGGLGPEDVVTRLRRIGQLRTPGASGGAGVTDSGVIGIVLEDATDYSLLLPVERIVELFTPWALPREPTGPLWRPRRSRASTNSPRTKGTRRRRLVWLRCMRRVVVLK